jgi:hypothetical protein
MTSIQYRALRWSDLSGQWQDLVREGFHPASLGIGEGDAGIEDIKAKLASMSKYGDDRWACAADAADRLVGFVEGGTARHSAAHPTLVGPFSMGAAEDVQAWILAREGHPCMAPHRWQHAPAGDGLPPETTIRIPAPLRSELRRAACGPAERGSIPGIFDFDTILWHSAPLTFPLRWDERGASSTVCGPGTGAARPVRRGARPAGRSPRLRRVGPAVGCGRRAPPTADPAIECTRVGCGRLGAG